MLDLTLESVYLDDPAPATAVAVAATETGCEVVRCVPSGRSAETLDVTLRGTREALLAWVEAVEYYRPDDYTVCGTHLVLAADPTPWEGRS